MTDIIVDIDGTIADLSHRVGFVRTKPKNWKAFNSGISLDKPIIPTIKLIQTLNHSGWNILLASGRSEEFKTTTMEWLNENEIEYEKLYMRNYNDSRKDDIVKSEIYDKILSDGYAPLFVIDDRKSVKKMWVERGVFVFDVNQKDLEY